MATRDTITSEGVLTRQGSWLILQCDLETVLYYQSWLDTLGVKVNLPIWKSHVSVVRGEDTDPEVLGTYDRETVCFQYRVSDIYTNGSYWWIAVTSQRLEEIRRELGLSPRPEYNFHLTLGKEYERRLGCRLGTECYRP